MKKTVIAYYFLMILIVICVASITSYVMYLKFQSLTVVESIDVRINAFDDRNSLSRSEMENDINMFVEKLIDEKINSEISKTISIVNYPITIFSIILTLFIVSVGFVSLKSINDSRILLEKVEKAPESILSEYYKKQIPILMKDLFDDNELKKSNAIRNLSLNPEINVDHYNQIIEIFPKELGKPC